MGVDYRLLAFRYGGALLVGLLYYLGVFSRALFLLTVAGAQLLLAPWYPVFQNEDTLIVGQSPYRIVEACVATAAYVLWALLVLTTKDTRGKIWKMLASGWALIYVVNMVRIVGLIIVDQTLGRVIFTTLHFVVWAMIGSVFVVALWIALSRRFGVRGVPVWDDIVEIRKGMRTKKL